MDCQSAKTGTSDNDYSQHKEAINHLWSLCTTVLKPVLHALQDKLPKTKDTISLYKGLQAPNIHALRKAVEDLKQGLPRTWVWSSSLKTAINEATPNKGRKGKLSIIDRRLLRKGHSDLVTNHVGIVLSYKTTAIPIAELTPTVTSDEFFVHFDHFPSLNVQTAQNPSEKAQLLCPTLPPMPQPALTNIIDSDLWLAIITDTKTAIANTNHPHPYKCTICVTPNKPIRGLESEKLTGIQSKPTSLSKTKAKDTPRRAWDPPTLQHKTQLPKLHTGSPPPMKSTSNTHGTKNEATNPWEPPICHQTSMLLAKTRVKSGREKPVVHTSKEFPLKHKLPFTPLQPRTYNPDIITRAKIPRASWPTRIVIQGHTFWRATPKSSSVQQWVFDIASTRDHKVCFVLLWRKT